MTILFAKSTYKPSEKISGTVSKPGKLVISKLATPVLTLDVDGVFEIDPMPEGSYSVELISQSDTFHSALEVISNPWQRIRYGFLSEFGDQVDTAKQVEWAKRLHLTSIHHSYLDQL